ncbi:uncharacterized protein LOC125242404 [Leguminivora glycinivorella]|uniref:uncharacterized protein LOC125242236 n=1 Tax=Leguminivora glycinivorella TaxID=1035111 RepID=UPI00200F215F|nr:uncharacterized protein LOC125242236 [Leguminivora glycinivorella]XP_048007163.1 uncharacterized protein LOC125242404 [Leguminivora glycinivorella]
MRAHALVFLVIIIIIINVDAGRDVGPTILPKSRRRMSFYRVPTKHRLALRSIEDDIQQSMYSMQSSIRKFKIDIHTLQSQYLPLIQTFENLLDKCEAMNIQVPVTPPPDNNGDQQTKHIKHHHHHHHHRETHHKHKHEKHTHTERHESVDQTR